MRVALVAARRAPVVAFLLLALTYAATAQETGGLKAYQDCLAAGDLSKALSAGKPLLEAIKAAHPGSPAATSIDNRLVAVQDACLLAISKLTMIADGAAAEHPSPYLYIAPKPAELLATVRDMMLRSAASYQGLTGEETSFAKSYIDAALFVADRDVVAAYQKVVNAKVGDLPTANARAYLSAYVIGAHDEGTYPAVLALLSKALAEGAIPSFLADDALNAFGDVRACAEALKALDSVTWAQWPQADQVRLYKNMAAVADRNSDNEWAIVAYGKIVAKGTPAEAEEAQAATIKIYAEKVKDYASAAHACGEYVKRYPKSKDALNSEYLKALYEWQANNFDAALVDIKAFRSAHADSGLMPSAILLEGLTYNSQGKLDDAVKSFGEVLAKYPKHRLAGKAQYLIGFAYLSGQKYSQARDAFQKVVDFYPGDSYAVQAKDYMEKLKSMPVQPSK
jgi:outer membrane protein assembly factor BamD (BamD/ComL family)